MKSPKTAIQRVDLNEAINHLTKAVRSLKSAGEPALSLRLGGLLKELLICRNESTLSQ